MCHCDQYNNEFTRNEFVNIVTISAKSSFRVITKISPVLEDIYTVFFSVSY